MGFFQTFDARKSYLGTAWNSTTGSLSPGELGRFQPQSCAKVLREFEPETHRNCRVLKGLGVFKGRGSSWGTLRIPFGKIGEP